MPRHHYTYRYMYRYIYRSVLVCLGLQASRLSPSCLATKGWVQEQLKLQRRPVLNVEEGAIFTFDSKRAPT